MMFGVGGIGAQYLRTVGETEEQGPGLLSALQQQWIIKNAQCCTDRWLCQSRGKKHKVAIKSSRWAAIDKWHERNPVFLFDQSHFYQNRFLAANRVR